jgi:hypothetical protein
VGKLKNSICHMISAVSREEVHIINTNTCTMGAFSQESNIYSTWCSNGEFLLHFLMVILTVTAYH